MQCNRIEKNFTLFLSKMQNFFVLRAEYANAYFILNDCARTMRNDHKKQDVSHDVEDAPL